MPKSGKSSQMSGSEQALEVAIVDVEKAVNLGTRRARFCLQSTHCSRAGLSLAAFNSLGEFGRIVR